MSMAKTIKFGGPPGETDLAWFVKNIGPRTHYTKYSIGGKGWKFTWSTKHWMLTIDDDKMLTYYLLVR